MTTAITTIKNDVTTVKVSFFFEEGWTANEYEKYEKKINRFISNTDAPTTASIFADRTTIEAIIQIDNNYIDKQYEKQIYRRLQNMIDSHKQPATYGWSMADFAQAK